MRSIHETERDIPIVEEADVIVAGAGPGGFPAAIAAARQGARVILIEKYGFAGGLATAGMINPILGHTASESSKPIVEGILKESIDRMHRVGGATEWNESLGEWGIQFEVEAFKHVADQMLGEAGVSVRYHTSVSAVAMAPVSENVARSVDAVITESKTGREAIAGKVFIDATGDADLAAWAGIDFTKGRKFDGAMQSMGSFIHFGGMANASMEQLAAARERLEEEMTAGRLHFYGTSFDNPGPRREVYFAPNMTRFAGDSTNARDLSRGELELRAEAWKLLSFLKKQPGLETAYILRTSACIGPRESRQIVGNYRLNAKDVNTGQKFADGIARGSWWVDIHCPLGHTYPIHLCIRECPKGADCPYWRQEHDGEMLYKRDLYTPNDDWYDIPYRALVAASHNNIIVSGRSISADHQGMAGARVMGTCMAIGEGAGIAAAMAADSDGIANVNAIETLELRKCLTEAGALV